MASDFFNFRSKLDERYRGSSAKTEIDDDNLMVQDPNYTMDALKFHIQVHLISAG